MNRKLTLKVILPLLLAVASVLLFAFYCLKAFRTLKEHLSLDDIPTKIDYTNHIPKRNELGELLKRGLSEEESLALFGGKNPEITQLAHEGTCHSYTYAYNADTREKLDAVTQGNHILFFELVFRNSRLVQAIEFRNAPPKAFFAQESFRKQFSIGNSMDMIIEALGEPKEIMYEKDQTRFRYVYPKKLDEMLFSKGHDWVSVELVFREEKLSDAIYEIQTVTVEQQTSGRLILRKKCQRYNCLGDEASLEQPIETLCPLDQFGIRSMRQLKKKLPKMVITGDDPFGFIIRR